jgi:DMSO/TMAO reductase YedYZ molybdopterin-dependent catalytic subunit
VKFRRLGKGGPGIAVRPAGGEELTVMSPVSRGFHRLHRAPAGEEGRVPPGQYVTDGFPVLSAGPTPQTRLEDWTFSIMDGGGTKKSWTWQEFRALPDEAVTADIHCVTRWTKLDTQWRGVPVDTLLDQAGIRAAYVLAFSDGGYTTNLPIEDVTGGKAWVAFGFDGAPLAPEHGGPARLLVPHLYFWKSAKWVRGLELRDHDRPGFWETYGYNMYGDPWKEQRYAGD